MSKQEFLNFNEISKVVSFEDILNWLNVAYERKGKELRGGGFIVNVEKNLFFCPENDVMKGSIINFVAHYKKIDLREAASLIKQQFLSKKEIKSKRSIPELTLEWDPYLADRGITPEVAREYEVGYTNQRSVMAGRICFKIYDHEGKHSGYIGYKEQDGSWHSPKGFKRPLYNAHRLNGTKSVIVTVDPFDALKIVSIGFPNITALLANSMTAEQQEQLERFRYILLFHQESQNIVNRLYNKAFVYAPVLSKSIKEMSKQELIQIIKPS